MPKGTVPYAMAELSGGAVTAVYEGDVEGPVACAQGDREAIVSLTAEHFKVRSRVPFVETPRPETVPATRRPLASDVALGSRPGPALCSLRCSTRAVTPLRRDRR